MKYVNLIKQNKRSFKKPKSDTKSWRKTAFIAFVSIISIAGLLIILGKTNIFNPISIVASISQIDVKQTDGRTNILVLGSDNTVGLTDTILVASIDTKKREVVLISIPRDLWVRSPNNYFSKINSLYTQGGIENLQPVVEEVLGIPIHYYGVIDFEIFKEIIDLLGGVTVDVERSFVDTYYPIEGNENSLCDMDPEEFEETIEELTEYDFPCRFETVAFNQGPQYMDSETALKYVRSRKGNNTEGTDFARAARQQRLIIAIKDKVLTVGTLLNPNKLKELHSIYVNKVDTNVTLGDMNNFYLLSQQSSIENIETLVLADRDAPENGGLLIEPRDKSLYNGQFVLIPRLGNYSQINAYVQRYLFGD